VARFKPQIQEKNSKVAFFFLILYTAAVFIRPQEWNVYNVITFPFIRIFIISAFLFYLFEQKPKVWGVQAWCLVGLCFVILLSGLRNYWFMGGVDSMIDFIIVSFIPFILFSSLVNSNEQLHKIFAISLFSTLFMVHHGYSQVMSADGIGWSGTLISQGTRIKYIGIFSDPNDMGMFLLMNVPIAFYFFSKAQNFIIKVAVLIVIGLLLWGIVNTNSRGTLVGLLALCCVYMVFRFGKLKAFIFIGICIPIAFVAMSKFRAIDTEEESAQGRIEAWYSAVQMFKYRPVVGVGKGNFMEHHGRTGHNSYAMVMAELGTLGYFFWFTFLIFTMQKLLYITNGIAQFSDVKPPDNKPPDNKLPVNKSSWEEVAAEYQSLAKVLLYSLTGYAATAFFLSRSYILFLFIFIGLATALIHRVERNYMEEDVRIKHTKFVLKRSIALSFISLVTLFFIIKILV
tara:strand:+ start:4849 stop:6216 length:1368 start_codon:yes stop_codon:yes gene_type:complete